MRLICCREFGLPHLGSRAPGAHEHHGLRLGVDGGNGHGDLAHGAFLPNNFAPSASPRAGAAFWNLGVLLGVVGIFAGDSTGYEWLEFPPYRRVVLFVAYSLVMSWAVLMFRFRRGDTIYITQWYLLGAFLWFPWLYAATQIMLFVVPVQGVMQAAVNWWYATICCSSGSARSGSAQPIT